jgi:alpha-beta hydrolase superfamily lysophospholipase
MSRADAERRLQRMTSHLLAWSETIPELREATGGRDAIERVIARVEHVFVPFPAGDLHLEVHPAEAADAPAIVAVPSIGAHARFQSAALGALREAGFHAIGLDRPGHGLAGGRRGHAPADVSIDAIALARDYAKARFHTPVGLIGHSLGGMIAWYALTRTQPIADAVVCAALIGHPEVLPTRQARIRAPLVRKLARIAPYRTMPIRKLLRFEDIALRPELLDLFDRQDDDVWAWRYTLAALASMLEFRPERDWTDVEIPALVIAGGGDRMTPEATVRAVLSRAQPPNAELHVIPGAGHMLFHEHLVTTLRLLEPWLKQRLRSEAVPASPPG